MNFVGHFVHSDDNEITFKLMLECPMIICEEAFYCPLYPYTANRAN